MNENSERTLSEERAEARDMTLVLNCVVRGYHACDFTVEDGEAFGRVCSGNAFKVIHQRCQLPYYRK